MKKNETPKEKEEDKKRRRMLVGFAWANRILDVVTIFGFFIMILIGGYAIVDSYMVYDGATLADDIAALSPTGKQDFRLDDLQKINKDIVAWIKVDGTHIDYPVVAGKDNSEYLNLDYKGEYATAGSVFMDYRNDRLFHDDYSIIYGHNMRADLMFSDIKRFENTAFFNTHRIGMLWTGEGTYELEFLYYAKFSAFNNRVYNLITYKNGRNAELMELFAEDAVNTRKGEFGKLLLLSTCNTAGSNDRAVLVANMTLVSGGEEIGGLGDLRRLEREKQILEGKSVSGEAHRGEVEVEKQSWFTGLTEWFGGFSIRDVLLAALMLVVIVIFVVLIVMEVRRRIEKRKKTGGKKVEK